MERQARLLNLLPDARRPDTNFIAARLISISSKDLTREMRTGSFREELYFRLSGFCLRVPALRQRSEDIPSLFTAFVAKYSTLLGCSSHKVKNSTMDLLMQYSWPGNVRELENVARKVCGVGRRRNSSE